MEQTFCFVDLAGFSALTETHGDETAANLIERFTAVVEEVREGEGQLVGTNGDAVFLVAREPVRALAILGRLWRRVESERDFPTLRAGLHHGEAAQRAHQFYGTAVNIAARVAAQASGGEVLGTEPIATAARAAGIFVRPLGRVTLKNLRDALELFSIAVAGEARTEIIDPVCRMRVVPEDAGAHLELDGEEYWFCSRECLRLFVGEGR